jgi:hypothetical protein
LHPPLENRISKAELLASEQRSNTTPMHKDDLVESRITVELRG